MAITIQVGGNRLLRADVVLDGRAAGPDPIWSTSDLTKAKVFYYDAAGVKRYQPSAGQPFVWVEGAAAGSATISAASGSVTATLAVTVVANTAPGTVTITPAG